MTITPADLHALAPGDELLVEGTLLTRCGHKGEHRDTRFEAIVSAVEVTDEATTVRLLADGNRAATLTAAPPDPAASLIIEGVGIGTARDIEPA